MKIIPRLFFCVALITSLNACGFHPVHGEKPANAWSNAAGLEEIAIDNIAGRPGQILKVEMEDLLHPSGSYPSPRYRLQLVLEEVKQPVVIERNARVSRYNLLFTARYKLIDINTGSAIFTSENKRMGSYNAPLSDFSTYVAEGDARSRTLKRMAEDIVMRLSIKLK